MKSTRGKAASVSYVSAHTVILMQPQILRLSPAHIPFTHPLTSDNGNHFWTEEATRRPRRPPRCLLAAGGTSPALCSFPVLFINSVIPGLFPEHKLEQKEIKVFDWRPLVAAADPKLSGIR